jgi:hypothetical protein
MIFIIDALLIDNVHITNDADEYILFIKSKVSQASESNAVL